MISKAVKSSAFYGRVDKQIHLKPFSLRETQLLMGKRGLEETVEAQMLSGGIPKYLHLLNAHQSIQEGCGK
jgi:hypothetical protein